MVKVDDSIVSIYSGDLANPSLDQIPDRKIDRVELTNNEGNCVRSELNKISSPGYK